MVHLTKRQSNLVRHQGGCHCAAVRFEVLASPSLTVFECNCSICVKKQIKYFLVPFNQFKLVKGHHSLQTYSFNTHQAKYNFCITCGVQPFHIPSSNPEAYGIAMHCLDEGTVKKVTYEKVDGKKEAQAKRKTPSGDKTSSATLGQKTDGKGQDQPLRKPSFIAMLNSWSQGQSTPSSADEKNQEESAQDPAATDTYRTRSKQSSPPQGPPTAHGTPRRTPTPPQTQTRHAQPPQKPPPARGPLWTRTPPPPQSPAARPPR
ncbi:uncharacterized protein [Panulirus ornatus]|uniref:uncharacterized protein n=1 Tax=Panulirus ornatus TaxID=150431 RepID=UPI003A8BE6CD